MFVETIAAIATPVGRGGIGIIRVSGPQCPDVAKAIVKKIPAPRMAELKSFYNENNEQIDEGLVLYFPHPNSFTGEDVLEFHGHGGPVVQQLLLKAILQCGVRMASPGEFTERAYLNGKMDLTQAEAVADLINASTEAGALGAARSLQGQFSEKILILSEKIMKLRILVEAGIDFAEEEIDVLSSSNLIQRIEEILIELSILLKKAKQGQILKDGMSVAIVGRPNAGKSSLLNFLTQENTAIVTPIPGTTRDLVKATIQLDGLPVHLVDTAGIRENADPIEREGMARGEAQQQLVDKIILLMDIQAHNDPLETEISEKFGDKVLKVYNKIDTLLSVDKSENNGFYISVKTGAGIPDLLKALKSGMQEVEVESSQFLSRQRHVNALYATTECVKKAKHQLEDYQAFELCAQELRYAQDKLGEIVGKVSSDELLGEIFSAFCIGK